MRILYLFSGAHRKSSLVGFLQKKAQSGFTIDAVEVDLSRDTAQDLSQQDLQQNYLQQIAEGQYDVVVITPPCSTWSRVRGPPMIRSKTYVWGFPWLTARHKNDAELGNILVQFLLEVLAVIPKHPINQWGRFILVLGEHPEDLGAMHREEDHAKLVPASIWQLPDLRCFVDKQLIPGLFTVVFGQCCFQAPYRKPTQLFTNVDPIRAWGPTEWPIHNSQDYYEGPLSNSCGCRPTQTLDRKPNDDGFATTGTGAYPPAMDSALADAIWTAWCSAPAEVGKIGAEHEDHTEERQKSNKVEHKEEGQRVRAEEQEEEGSSKKMGVGAQDRQPVRPEGDGFRQRAGKGIMMEAMYKGERRGVNDGGGLRSPGRWKPKDRRRTTGRLPS